MCLLTFFPDGVVPSDRAIDGLHNGAIFNSDGHGYAIVAGDHIIVRRGLKADAVIDSFVEQRKRYPEGPALFHSRIGTAGVISKKNCHPFYVGADQRTVLAHNGILPKLAQPRKGDLRSDTRYLAECMLPWRVFGQPLTCKTDAKLFERWLTPYNKIVVLTTNPKYPKSSYIFNLESGSWDYGAWWSNDSYYPYVSQIRARNTYTSGERYVVTERNKSTCPTCKQANGVSDDWRVCWACGCCADCNQSWSKDECLCYIPSRGKTYFSDTTTTLGYLDDDEVGDAIKAIMAKDNTVSETAMQPLGITCSTCNRDILYCDHTS